VNVIRWEDPPGSRPLAESTWDTQAVAAALRSQPGRWAVVVENPPSTGTASQIKQGVLTIYARYIGGDGGTPNA
jgi:hypothetical protein